MLVPIGSAPLAAAAMPPTSQMSNLGNDAADLNLPSDTSTVMMNGENVDFVKYRLTAPIAPNYANVRGMGQLTLEQYRSLTLKTFVDYNIYGTSGAPPAFQEAFQEIVGLTGCRGQQQTPDSPRICWENSPVSGGSVKYHYSFFPAVGTSMKRAQRLFPYQDVGAYGGALRLDEGGPLSQISALVYVVFYANTEPPFSPHGSHSIPLIGPPSGKWRRWHNARAGSPDFFINTDFLNTNDDSIDLAFQNAMELAQPEANWYVWIMPMVNFARTPDWTRLQVRGASGCLAMIGAVTGCPSVLTTGFIRDIAEDTVVGPDVSVGADGSESYVQAVVRSLGAVEHVDMIVPKALLAIYHRSPIVFPALSIAKSKVPVDIQAVDIRNRVLQAINNNMLGHFAKTIYTSNQLERGVPLAQFKTPFFMVQNLADYTLLSTCAFLAWMLEFPRVGAHISEKYFPQNNGYGTQRIFTQPDQEDAYENLDAALLSQVAGFGKAQLERMLQKRRDANVETQRQLAPLRAALKNEQWAQYAQMRNQSIGQKAEEKVNTSREKATARVQRVEQKAGQRAQQKQQKVMNFVSQARAYRSATRGMDKKQKAAYAKTPGAVKYRLPAVPTGRKAARAKIVSNFKAAKKSLRQEHRVSRAARRTPLNQYESAQQAQAAAPSAVSAVVPYTTAAASSGPQSRAMTTVGSAPQSFATGRGDTYVNMAPTASAPQRMQMVADDELAME